MSCDVCWLYFLICWIPESQRRSYRVPEPLKPTFSLAGQMDDSWTSALRAPGAYQARIVE